MYAFLIQKAYRQILPKNNEIWREITRKENEKMNQPNTKSTPELARAAPENQTPFLSAEQLRNQCTKSDRLRVAAYIRVSTEAEEQESSFEAQERYFQRILNDNPAWESAGIYADYGRSGTGKENRIGLQRLLRHCREGRIDRIVCKSISRLARNTADLITALNILREHGVSICFEKEGLDTAQNAGEFILTVLGAVAQEESRSISTNIQWSNQKRFPRGEVPNRIVYGYRYSGKVTVSPDGYRCRAVEIVEEEAIIVRRIFAEVIGGSSYGAIARALNAEKISAPCGKTTWQAAQIGRMLRCERYVGDVLAQKTYTPNYLTHKTMRNRGERTKYLVQNHHPAILEREVFQRAQEIVQNNAVLYGRRQPRIPRILSGRLVCACCGRRYYACVRREVSWYCPSAYRTRGNRTCDAEIIREKQVWALLRAGFLLRFGSAAKQKSESMVQRVRRRMEQVQTMDTQELYYICKEHTETEPKRPHDSSYWEAFERDHESRVQAQYWMQQLPTDKWGDTELLDGVCGMQMHAFVLSIVIHTPNICIIHWFDDSCTEVRLDAERDAKAEVKKKENERGNQA
jgi:DNA invertase Pin-like site-specific DNA recombinase